MEASYAIAWREDDEPTAIGRLVLQPGRFSLIGIDEESRAVTREVARDDVGSVRPAPNGQRLRGARTAVVRLRSGHELALASLDKPGTWLELVNNLASGRAGGGA
ncbi:MAG: hypothetical protein ICV74_04000 [Thermoleophilia bacterium]|nr:hypothetical protein [Thermoleophilia bacterium]